MTDVFTDKTLLITGGTGTFGNAVLRHSLGIPFREFRVFSRDEKKQDEMRRAFPDPRVKFYIGDVRDPNSLNDAASGVDFIFHAAA
ncbi:MAG: polysaccharide biosynthesis protein, partial [Gemmatimonadaceae bacterium]